MAYEGNRKRWEARAKLIRAALACAQDEFTDPSDPHHDAQSELDDEMLIEAANEYVEALNE